MNNNINSLDIYGIVIVLLIVIVDLTFARNHAPARINTAMQLSAQTIQLKLQRVIGERVFSFRFLLSTFVVISAILFLCLFVGGTFNNHQQKIIWFTPATVFSGILSVACSHFVVRQLCTQQRLHVVFLLLLFWLLTPALLWLAVMHFGTWLVWRGTNSPLAYASEWFYAQVYDNYFRDPVGFTFTLAIATAIATPVVAPMIGIVIQTIRSITNLKRGVVSVLIIVLFVLYQLTH